MEKWCLDFVCTVYYFSFILLDLEAPCSVRQLSSSFRWHCVGSEKELALLGCLLSADLRSRSAGGERVWRIPPSSVFHGAGVRRIFSR
jgi:hypothetical protein